MTDTSSDTESTTTPSRAGAPIARRTVLAGTAFAVPAIMITASTPAFAASGLTIAFDKSAYSGAACSAISGVTVAATSSGAPQAGVSVTATLSNGWTFASGGTSSTNVTGTGGSVVLPDINVPASATNATISASASGTSSISASLSATSATTAVYLENGTQKAAVGVASGAIPVGSTEYLNPDGSFINGVDGTVFATNVASFGQMWVDSTGWRIPLKKKDGSTTYVVNGSERATVGVPTGSAPITATDFLAPDGRLIEGTSGNVYASNVKSVGQLYADNRNGWRLPLAKTDGTTSYLTNGTETATTGVPSGSKPIVATDFLASDGRYINGSNGNVYATNVKTVGQMFIDNTNSWRIPLAKTDGSTTFVANGTERSTTGVPVNSTPIVSSDFLTPDGRYINGSNGSVYTTSVQTFGQMIVDSSNNWRVPLTLRNTVAAYVQNGTQKLAVGVSPGATPAASTYFLTSDGRFVNGVNGAVLASNVELFGQIWIDSQAWRIPLKKKDGSTTYIVNGTERATVGVPTGSAPITATDFLAPDGRLIEGTSGSVYAANVRSVGQLFSDPKNGWRLPLTKTDGSTSYLTNGTESATTGVPNGSKPVVATDFLSSDGRYINGSNGIAYASNVQSIGLMFIDGTNSWRIPLLKKDGTTSFVANGTERATSGVPTNSEPVVSSDFVSPSGDYINGSNGSVYTTGVMSFGQMLVDNSQTWTIPLALKRTSC